MPTPNEVPLTRFRAFAVKRIAPKDDKPTKIQVHDVWHNTRRTFSYNHEGPREQLDQAELFLAGLGIRCCGITCSIGNSHYDTLLTEDFETKINLRKGNAE
jgi:hypothetical protein